MKIKYHATELPGVILIEPEILSDHRGYFLELFHQKKYAGGGIAATFVQDNFSCSVKNTLRGLHFQMKRPQAKLVTVLRGEIFDVAVDLRPRSPTYRKWAGATLSGENKKQIFIPEGFAHGFCVVSETAEILYKCSDFYDPTDEGGILWSDPAIGIRWPVKDPIVSQKDLKHPRLKELKA